jgi:hypothetical protein
MAKHDPVIAAEFTELMTDVEKLSEADLLERVNKTVLKVEMDDTYSTKAKLKIFSLITYLSNCTERERKKYVRKISRALK